MSCKLLFNKKCKTYSYDHKKISYKRPNYHFQILDPNWAHTLKHRSQNISHKNHISPEKLALIINNLNNGKTLDDISDLSLSVLELYEDY